MTLSAVSAFDSHTPMREFDGVPFPNRKNESLEPTSRQNNGDGGMDFALGKNERRFRGDPRANTSLRDAKTRNADWLGERAARESAKHIADKTGLTPKAVENLRQRKNKISFDNLIEWMRNDPDFAAELAAYVGLILPGEAEYAGALTRAVNARVRQLAATQIIGKGEE